MKKYRKKILQLLPIIILLIAVLMFFVEPKTTKEGDKTETTTIETQDSESNIDVSKFEVLEPVEISYTEFLKQMYFFEDIVINTSELTVTGSHPYFPDEVIKSYRTKIISVESFMDTLNSYFEGGHYNLDLSNVRIENDAEEDLLLYRILVILPLLAMIIYMLLSILLRKKVLNIHSEKDNRYEVTKTNVKFSDVAGLKEEKLELSEIVDFLKNPEKYAKLGAKVPRGVLLSGNPGTGKTLLAKAVAGEANVSFISASGSDFIEYYAGTGAARIRNLFEVARKNSPCIVFIDEIDAIGCKRNDSDIKEYHQTIEQLLTELDGFNSKDNDIVILAATNRAESLDSALTRAGRFDRKIVVNLPDLKEREEILLLHSKNKKFSKDVDLSQIAKITVGYSGADLANLLNEAALLATRADKDCIEETDIIQALKKITMGLEKSGRVISEEEKKLISCHEAGHATMSLILGRESSIKEVSIISRGALGGYTWNDVEEKSYKLKKELKDDVLILLAGKAAEEILISDTSTGVSQDLQQATKIVSQMIAYYGMNENIGSYSMLAINDSEIYLTSEKQLDKINEEIATSLKKCQSEAISKLTHNIVALRAISEKLFEKETLSGEELTDIFNATYIE